MRIAQVTATFPPYEAGTGRVCYYNAIELARQGHQVSVYTGSTASDSESLAPPDGLTIHRLPALVRMGNAPLLPALLRLSDFDLIHLHWPFIFGAELVWLASMRTSIPLVITYHNDLISDGVKGKLFDAYLAVVAPLVFSRARKLLAVTLDHASHSRLAHLFKRHWADVIEIPNGVDTAHFHARPEARDDLRRKYKLPPDAFAIVFVGALDAAHHYRRVDLLIDAVAQLRRPDLHLVVVGDGDLRPHYEQHAEAKGVRQQTHFLGKRGHDVLPEIYNIGDVVVLPSQLQESFGMVLIEGMACGLPAIASTLPGVRMIVNHGEDGLLIEPGNMMALADAIESLMKDPTRRQQMGLAGRRKVEAKYTWAAIGNALVKVYQEVISA